MFEHQERDPFPEDANVTTDRERVAELLRYVASKAASSGAPWGFAVAASLDTVADCVVTGQHWSRSPEEREGQEH